MTLTQQSPSNNGAAAADGHHYAALYHHHSTPVVLHGAPQQVSNYVVAGTPGGQPGMLQGQPVPLPTPGPHQTYPSGMTGHAAFPGSTLNQQHSYIHQPVQQVAQRWTLLSQMGFHSFFSFDVWIGLLCFSQVSACYCSSIHHPPCSSQQQQQHYRPPVNHSPHNGLHSQTLSQQQGSNSHTHVDSKAICCPWHSCWACYNTVSHSNVLLDHALKTFFKWMRSSSLFWQYTAKRCFKTHFPAS